MGEAWDEKRILYHEAHEGHEGGGVSTRWDPDEFLPVEAGVYATANDGIVSRLIRYVTRPSTANVARLADWSHVGLAFAFRDGSRERHEALASEGWTRKSWEALVDWVGAGGRATMCWMPLDSVQVRALYRISCDHYGTASYAFAQLVQYAVLNSVLLRWAELGLPARPGRVNCSEGVSRFVHQATAGCIDLRPRAPEGTFDSVTPQEVVDRIKVLAATGTGWRWEEVGTGKT